MREVVIPPNFKDLVKHISQSGAPENIDLRNTWFDPYFKKYPSETPNHLTRVATENNRNMITSFQSVKKVPEILLSEGASVSEVIEFAFSEGVENKSNLPKKNLLNNHPACPVG